MFGPDPNAVHPNPAVPSVCFIKNTVTRPNIVVGDYTYYDDPVDSERFEDHVTHHYEFLGDKLVIGKFLRHRPRRDLYHERRQPSHGFGHHLSLQHHGRRLGNERAAP